MVSSDPIRFVGNRDLNFDDAQLSLFADTRTGHQNAKSGGHGDKASISYVNHLQCVLVRDHLRLATEWSASEQRFALSEQSHVTQLRALIYLISICDRLNWDFVLGVLADELSKITNSFDSEAVLALSLSDLRRAFGNYRRNDGNIKFSQKLKTLHAVAAHISSDLIDQLLCTSQVHGDQGAKMIIEKIPGYSADPMKKKCNALLHEIVRRQLMIFSDADTIDPAIDYHIMRLYLRTGRVEVRDASLARRLVQRGRIRVERITEIRRVVAEAMRYTAWINGLTISRLNDLEWLFARKACRRDGVWCFGVTCPLEQVCPSAKQSPVRMITEPDSRHGYY